MNEKYDQVLLNGIFSGMLRNQDTKVYFNIRTQDVQQETNGCLSSLLATDQSTENRRLLGRIQMGEYDDIIEGIHILIPNLTMFEFIKVFKENIENNNVILEFLNQFEQEILEEYKDIADHELTLNDIFFNHNTAQDFFEKLGKWSERNQVDQSKTNRYLQNAINYLSIDFIENCNTRNLNY